MPAYLLKRFILFLFTLWSITLISFVILQLAPGSPLEMKLLRGKGGGLSSENQLTDEVREQMKERYHLDKPILNRYALWVRDLVHLDFGHSFSDQRPVEEKIVERLPVSLIFGISSLVLSLLVGIPLGLLGARFQNTWIDRWITIKVIAMYSIPVYVFGILLLTFLGGGGFLDWFPIYGIQSDDYETMSLLGRIIDRTYHFILPCTCYCIGSLAFITQQQRASMLESLQQDYVRTARAKGVSEWGVFLKHALRNSLIPIATVVGALIPSILGGGIIIEQMFSVPGLGLLSYEALLQRDYPTIMATFTISAVLYQLGILFSDLLYVAADPRIHFESAST